MSKQEEIRERVAKLTHMGERIWAKIYNTPDPHNCKWEELSDYHRELYLAGAEFLLTELHLRGAVIKVGRKLEPLIEEE